MSEKRSHHKKPEKRTGERIDRLPVKLTEQELQARGLLLADACRAVEVAEADKKEADRQMTVQINKLKGRRSELQGIVIAKEERRDVVVGIYSNYKEGIVKYIREDTKELIDSRSMTNDERQMTINFKTEEQAKKDEAKFPLPDEAKEALQEAADKIQDAEPKKAKSKSGSKKVAESPSDKV